MRASSRSTRPPAGKRPPVLTITLNPALDITTTTEQLLPHRKLRCTAPRYDPGGGGVNVSRAIKELGGDSTAFVALGGSTGAQYRSVLEAAGLDCIYWHSAGETRFSLTVMEGASGEHFRFVLPGPDQPAREIEPLFTHLTDAIRTGFRFVVGSGGLPPGIPEDLYGRLAEVTRNAGGAFILDTHGAAMRAALPYRPYLIRLNHLEAQELVGAGSAQATEGIARELIARDFAEVAIVTLGEDGAIVATAGREFRFRPPKVVVRSAVGAGDSFVGALTLGLARNWPLEAAARYGVAAAAAAVTSEATELCKAGDVERIFAQLCAEAGELVPSST